MEDLFKKHGYIIFPGVFTEEELEECKEEIKSYIENYPSKLLSNSGGISIPDFINYHTSLTKTINLKNNQKLNQCLLEIFQDNNFRFCAHNDIGKNRIVGWHKDRLNNTYAKFQKHDIWTLIGDESHEIVKVLIYLESHVNSDTGLAVVPGSHLNRKITQENAKRIDIKKGDIVIFDQRISHRGALSKSKEERILVSFGFGRNNIFTDEFENGTIQRQKDQNRRK